MGMLSLISFFRGPVGMAVLGSAITVGTAVTGARHGRAHGDGAAQNSHAYRAPEETNEREHAHRLALRSPTHKPRLMSARVRTTPLTGSDVVRARANKELTALSAPKSPA